MIKLGNKSKKNQKISHFRAERGNDGFFDVFEICFQVLLIISVFHCLVPAIPLPHASSPAIPLFPMPQAHASSPSPSFMFQAQAPLPSLISNPCLLCSKICSSHFAFFLHLAYGPLFPSPIFLRKLIRRRRASEVPQCPLISRRESPRFVGAGPRSLGTRARADGPGSWAWARATRTNVFRPTCWTTSRVVGVPHHPASGAALGPRPRGP